MIVLPGGLPGTTFLSENRIVKEQCVEFTNEKNLAVICAETSVLASLGLIEGKPAACHPAFEEKIAGANVTRESISVYLGCWEYRHRSRTWSEYLLCIETGRNYGEQGNGG